MILAGCRRSPVVSKSARWFLRGFRAGRSGAFVLILMVNHHPVIPWVALDPGEQTQHLSEILHAANGKPKRGEAGDRQHEPCVDAPEANPGGGGRLREQVVNCPE